MKGLRRKTDRIRIVAILSAMTLCGFGRLAMAGPAGYIDTYAGGGPGTGEKATSASFSILSVAADGSGDVYFSTYESGLSHVYKVDEKGALTVIAGKSVATPWDKIDEATSVFISSGGVALDSAGNVYFADMSKQLIRRVDKATGIITTVAGNGFSPDGYSGGYSGDGDVATIAELNRPFGIAFDSSGNLYIADAGNNRIRKVDHTTGIITTIAGTGEVSYKPGGGFTSFSGDGGLATAAQINSPDAIAFDPSGNLYITDSGNYRVRKVDKATGIITTVAGIGKTPEYGQSIDGGLATSEPIYTPDGIAFDPKGDLYIAGHYLYKVDHSTGIITTVVKENPDSDVNILDVGSDSRGNLYVVDQIQQVITKMTTVNGVITDASCSNNCSEVSVIAGNGSTSFGGDGEKAAFTQFNKPVGISFDADDNLYIADKENNRIRKIDHSTGITTTVAGPGDSNDLGDDGLSTFAMLNSPSAVAFDASGNLFIADTKNDRIRKMDHATGIITTVAGTGAFGYSGDGGPAITAELAYPTDIAFDSSGNLYIADSDNVRIRKVDHATGIITTVAGYGIRFTLGDKGPAISAGLNEANYIAFNSTGNLLILDSESLGVRQVAAINGIITSDSIITTNANASWNGYDEWSDWREKHPSVKIGRIYFPDAIAEDAVGNVFLGGFGVIRKVDLSSGIYKNVAGDIKGELNFSWGFGNSVYYGDGVPATSAYIAPGQFAFDSEGNLYFVDYTSASERIRIVYQAGADKRSPSVSIAYGLSQSSGEERLRVSLQDKGSGFETLSLTDATNVMSPVFQEKIRDSLLASGAAVGSSNPIDAYFTKSDDATPASFSFSASDVAGNATGVTSIALLPYTTTRALSHAFASVAKERGIVSILSSVGGLRNVVVTANGRATTIGDLTAGEVRAFDLRSQLSEGNDNKIEVSAEGDSGTEACAIISTATLSEIGEEGSNLILSRGDLNRDGRIDVTDATMLLRSLTGLTIPSPIERALGDVNLDGKLNVVDAVAMLRGIVGG